MSDRVSVAEAEDRLRRTLARRAGDVPPAEGPVLLPAARAELALVPAPAPSRFAPRRRLLAAAAAAAACLVAAAALGAGLSRDRETTEIVPAQEPPTTATTAPPADEQGPKVIEETPLVPVAVAGFGQPGQAPSQDVWLYATWYPSPLMATEVGPGDTREAVTGAEVPADLDTAGDYLAITVWLRYDDGVLGLHSGQVSHDEMVAMAQSVHRTPGTSEFTMTPPPGWEPDGSGTG